MVVSVIAIRKATRADRPNTVPGLLAYAVTTILAMRATHGSHAPPDPPGQIKRGRVARRVVAWGISTAPVPPIPPYSPAVVVLVVVIVIVMCIYVYMYVHLHTHSLTLIHKSCYISHTTTPSYDRQRPSSFVNIVVRVAIRPDKRVMDLVGAAPYGRRQERSINPLRSSTDSPSGLPRHNPLRSSCVCATVVPASWLVGPACGFLRW